MRFWKRRKKAKEQPEAKQNIEDVLEHLNTRGAYCLLYTSANST